MGRSTTTKNDKELEVCAGCSCGLDSRTSQCLIQFFDLSSLRWPTTISRTFHHLPPVHTASEEFKNTTITGHFGFVLGKNSDREIT